MMIDTDTKELVQEMVSRINWLQAALDTSEQYAATLQDKIVRLQMALDGSQDEVVRLERDIARYRTDW